MKRKSGFSLIELMIVIAIVALLVGLSLPAYQNWVRKANRGDAQQLLLNWANNQEIWRSNDNNYATTGELPAPTHDKYDFSIAYPGGQATTYTLTATAKSGIDQANDKERGTPCTPMSLTQSGAKDPPVCWQ